MRSRDDLCLIVNGVQWFSIVAHIIFSAVFPCFSDCSQTIYLLLCIHPNLQFVVQLEKTK